jgi:hypothetical protein
MKLNMRKKLVSLAIASALSGGAMMATPAHALSVSKEHLGQVLIFPYYTVKNGYDTLFSVTNTSDQTAIIKVRWREALNSREVRDFNVILSPFDVWTGVVTATANGAAIRTFDKSCTSPILPTSPTVPGSREIAFTNLLFSGNFDDGATDSMERVREGYFEVFLMGLSSRSTSASSNTIEYNAKHVSGTPRDCSKVDTAFLDVNKINNDLINASTGYPENVLKGHSSFINVTTGKAMDAEPTTLENFHSSGPYVYAPGDVDPSLNSGDGFGTAWRLVDGNPDPVPFIQSIDGVSDLLRATSIINEYATGSTVDASWVMTFPTKHFYTDAYTPGTGPTVEDGTPSGGFSEWFHTKTKDGKSCDNIGVSSYDREEFGGASEGTDFSPAPVGSSVELCYETNVVDFNGTSVFGAGDNHLGFTASGAAGWAQLTFTEDSATTVGGLPVIGFSAIVRSTGDASTNYGSSEVHSYTRPYYGN